nr:hypothetical protein [uncultured Desulfobacter sp.]
MKKDYQIWNIFHDGELVEIQGKTPGDIQIKVKIEYVANILKGNHNHIDVILKNCSLFEYERQWSKDSCQIYRTIKELEGISPALVALSCDEEFDYLVIWDICGSIKTKYDSAELKLEDGEPLSFEELDSASKEYWNNWGAKHRT